MTKKISIHIDESLAEQLKRLSDTTSVPQSRYINRGINLALNQQLPYNLSQYIDSCKKFAYDTKSWLGIDDNLFYTTEGVGSWDESSDNAHGGLCIRWAFHKTAEDIDAEAIDYYIAIVTEELQHAIDELMSINDSERDILQALIGKLL